MFDIYELNDAAIQHNCNALHSLTTRLDEKVDFGSTYKSFRVEKSIFEDKKDALVA